MNFVMTRPVQRLGAGRQPAQACFCIGTSTTNGLRMDEMLPPLFDVVELEKVPAMRWQHALRMHR